MPLTVAAPGVGREQRQQVRDLQRRGSRRRRARRACRWRTARTPPAARCRTAPRPPPSSSAAARSGCAQPVADDEGRAAADDSDRQRDPHRGAVKTSVSCPRAQVPGGDARSRRPRRSCSAAKSVCGRRPQRRAVGEHAPMSSSRAWPAASTRVADRVLHPRVGGDDEVGRQQRRRARRARSWRGGRAGKPALAEDPQPEKVDSRKNAASPSIASGAPKTSPTKREYVDQFMPNWNSWMIPVTTPTANEIEHDLAPEGHLPP